MTKKEREHMELEAFKIAALRIEAKKTLAEIKNRKGPELEDIKRRLKWQIKAYTKDLEIINYYLKNFE